MSKPWIFVSPANRGIGATLTRHLLRTTTLPIVATSRSTSPAAAKKALLADLSLPPSSSSSSSSSSSAHDHGHHGHDRLTVLPLDVTGQWHMHLGFALPGVLTPERSPQQVSYDAALETFKVNTLGPLMLMKWFADRFLPRKGTELLLPPAPPSSASSSSSPSQMLTLPPNHATWTTLSARLSSIADNTLGGWYSYRASKAGVNQLTKTFDLHLAGQRSQRKAMAIAYHPGTVRTDFTRDFWTHVPKEQLFGVDYAVERLVDVVVAQAQIELHRGKCWDWKGEEVLP
ncbi:NADPH-dependent aldehyde reductase-like protein [Apiospora saccharicola]|uniref:NADPH-dependent aldehyde reductase-like protein n=1 Tax=Apiospora saccharicola TaxID=335842 RepID=A0ABR1WIT9_9PEZI